MPRFIVKKDIPEDPPTDYATIVQIMEQVAELRAEAAKQTVAPDANPLPPPRQKSRPPIPADKPVPASKPPPRKQPPRPDDSSA